MSKRNVPNFEDQEHGPQAEGMSDQNIQDESISDVPQESFSDSEMEEAEMEETEQSPLLTREMKIGLAVVLVLIVVLGALLVKRFPLGGGAQEDKQTTAKADSKSTGSSSGGASGSPAASAVSKPTGAHGAESGSQAAPSKSPPWIPTSWTSGSNQSPSGTAKISPEGNTSVRVFPPAPFPGTSPNGAEGKGKTPTIGPAGGSGSGSGSGSTNGESSFGPMSSSPGRESVLSGNNPLRADSGGAPGAAPGPPKEGPTPSGNSSGPLLYPTNEANPTALPQGQRQGSSFSLPGGYHSSMGNTSPYTPPVWGSQPKSSAESGKDSGPASSGAEKGTGGLTAPPSGMGLTALPSGTGFPGPASPTGGGPPGPAALRSSPAGSPASSAQTELFPQPRSYVVQSGDSYWTISERFYGTGSYYQALAEYNRSRNARLDHPRVGDQLMIPPQEELRRLYPQLCPAPAGKEPISGSSGGPVGSSPTLVGGYPPAKPEPSGPDRGVPERSGLGRTVAPSGLTYRVYIVQEGDSIYEIARSLLGKASRWVEIYELNKEVIGENLEYLRPGTRLAIPQAEPGNSPGPMSGVPPPNWPR